MKRRTILALGLLACSASALAAEKSLTADYALHRDTHLATALDLDRDTIPTVRRQRSAPAVVDLARLRLLPGNPAVSVARLRSGKGTPLQF